MENQAQINKAKFYRMPPNKSTFVGMDLMIDSSTQVLCETYNKSSGATRSVLYVLLIITIISLVSVFNSNWRFNWDSDRIAQQKENLIRLVKGKEKVKHDSLKSKLFQQEIDVRNNTLNSLIRSDVENNYTVKVSFLGLVIDINDLASISGATLIILITILRFTMTREKNNLKIAFNAINERYSDLSDYATLKERYEKNIITDAQKKIAPGTQNHWLKIISDANFIRRRYHYNFLSMNEVFNLPKLDLNNNDRPDILSNKSIKLFINEYLYYFFLFVYSYIIFNDFCSVGIGLNENPTHTLLMISFSLICLGIMFNVCHECVEQKKIVSSLFNNFWKNNYTYDYQEYRIKDIEWYKRLFYPLILLTAIYLISFVVTHASFLNVEPQTAKSFLSKFFG